jgi:hypothetical protein
MQRRDRLIQEWVHDTYKQKSHISEPTVCPQCGAVYHKGRWSWHQPPDEAASHACPACLRIRDRCPAGWVHIGRSFFDTHEEELMHLIDHVHAREKDGHPLNRIVDIEHRPDEVVVSTTNHHLARAIGEALNDAHPGELQYHYERESPDLIVRWKH